MAPWGAVHRAPGDYPDGKQGDVLTVEFTVAGIACIGLNGGPQFKHNEAFSFQIATDDQAETDRLWNAIVKNGGQESQCGWCKDRWGGKRQMGSGLHICINSFLTRQLSTREKLSLRSRIRRIKTG